jgi:hypothetical protein
MNANYQPFIEIRVVHEYYSSGVCSELLLEPTTATKQFLDRYGLLSRALPGLLQLYRDVNSAWKRAELSPLCFSFSSASQLMTERTEIYQDAEIKQAAATAPDLAAATAPDLSVFAWCNNVDYGSQGLDSLSYKLLHSTANAFDGASYPVCAPLFNYKLKEPTQDKQIKIRDLRDRVQWNTKFPVKPVSAVTIDVRTLTEGLYQIQLEDAAPQRFLLSTLTPATVWGVVQIDPGLIPADAVLPYRFLLAFPARKSIWRYVVMSGNKNERDYSSYEIVVESRGNAVLTDSGRVTFTGPILERMQGQNAWIFESTSPLTLKENPGDDYLFTLRPKGKSNGYPLPYASPSLTRLDRSQNGQTRYCSEIFVNLNHSS